MELKKRCPWCNPRNERYVKYHDEEWGVPCFDDAYLYEMLLLECFQAGLSWECVLNKRENFRNAYDGFDLEKVLGYGKEKIDALLQDAGLIRNRRKIEGSIKNSRVFHEILREYGSFYAYLEGFTKGRIFYETGLCRTALSDAISGDLRRRGMVFVGSVTVYSYLQAIGVIYSHSPECDLYKKEQEKETYL